MGRQGDFLNVNRKAAEIHKRLGASEIKVLAALAGAPQSQWPAGAALPGQALCIMTKPEAGVVPKKQNKEQPH